MQNNFSTIDLPFELLQRKILLCQDVLKVYDILDPGETNQRSNVLFELNCAVIMDVKLKLARREIDRKETQVCLPGVKSNTVTILIK